MTDIAPKAPDSATDFGANSWLVDEMYEQFRRDPASVGESWQEFFSDYKTQAEVAATAPSTAPVSAPAVAAAAW